jgi:hypothetical protein
MDEYLAKKILKEYEIKCDSNRRFLYLMIFNIVFTCFFLVLSYIYVFKLLLSGKPSFWFYVLKIFIIALIIDKLFIRGDYNKRNTINNMLDNMVLLINQI